MAKYVDVDLAIELHNGKLWAWDVYDLEPFLDDVPAADVVEVVRCKDCRYFTEGMAVGMCKRIEDKPIIPCCFDHFCSYGARKDERK